ncbi:MAG: glycosyltransferase family 2 protein [Rikenellaceae bacterium]
MISIITAVYNQLSMNKIYWENLVHSTDGEFELIIIDNNSTDGSREYFESLDGRVKVIHNDCNYSYPHSQNQGVEIARGDILAFFNNDMILSPHWDSRIQEVLGHNGNEILSLGSNDRCCDKEVSRQLQRRWKRFKYPIITLFGQSRFALKLMVRLCYGNWDRYCQRHFERYGLTTTQGFSGSAIIVTRRAMELIEIWDPRQQGADFNLFYQTCDYAERVGEELRPISIVNGIFANHYRRLTFYQKFPPFTDIDNIGGYNDNWSNEQLARYNRVIDEFEPLA